MPEKFSFVDFERRLDALQYDDGFKMFEAKQKAITIAALRDEYKRINKLSGADARLVDGLAKIRSDYVKPSRYTVDGLDLKRAEIQLPDINSPDGDSAIEEIEKIREQIPTAIQSFDPLFREDFEYQIVRGTFELERQVRGMETNRVEDIGYRSIQGFSSTIMHCIPGINDDSIESYEAATFPENPKNDGKILFGLNSGAAGPAFFITIIAIIAVILFIPIGRESHSRRHPK